MTLQGDRFAGRIGLTVAESEPAWPERPRPPAGAPNVLMIVLDDVGFGGLGCYGSRIETPNIDRLAARGLRFRNFHTCALCSPTRSCLLTGRNHHTNALGNIAESASGFPGYHGMIPRSSGFISRVMQRSGYATFAVGKWHLTSPVETSAAGPFGNWPLGRGFDRFHGFLGGETDQFAPDLVSDNHRVERPREEGYHLTDGLVRAGLGFLRDLRAVDRGTPWFMYWCSGACHAPHQVPDGYAERYRGRFDDGWDALREETLRRQVELGLMPGSARLSPRPEVIRPWASLSDDERRLYARQMEVYAAFLTHTDEGIGRLLDGIEALGETEDTLVILTSDNGASAEGQDHGTFNENLMFNGIPATVEENLAHYDAWGSADTFAHYAHGWALATNTPFPKWKRTAYRGGTADPLIVCWPRRVGDPGAVRPQYAHAIDVAATVLDAAGLEMPDLLDGVPQVAVAGRSFADALGDPAAPEHRRLQYYEVYGNRAIYRDGWVAVSFHPTPGMPSDGAGDPTQPELDMPWELYDLRSDPSQSRNLAADHPGLVRDLDRLWFAEAGIHGVFPVNSNIVQGQTPRPDAGRREFTYWPGTSPVPNDAAPDTLQRPFRVDAAVEIPASGAEGVLVAQGGQFGGWALYLRDGRVTCEYNYLGLERYAGSVGPVGEGRHAVSLEIRLAGEFDISPPLTAAGTRARGGVATLQLDEDPPVEFDLPKMIPYNYSLNGEGLCCGFDSETAVSLDYEAPFPFTGRLERVTVTVEGEKGGDPEKDAERAWLVQ